MHEQKLAQKSCTACQGATHALNPHETQTLHKQLNKAWKVVQEKQLEREFTFPDFNTALAFTNKIGAIAEEEGHHPDIYLTWGKVKITLFTHKINGLSESDFVLAAKYDLIH